MSRAPGTRRRLPEAHAVFAVPGEPDTPSGGYGYDRRIAAELRAAGWDLQWLRLPDGFPDPSAAALSGAYARLARQQQDTAVMIDGLALGAMPDVGEVLGPRRPLVALVHHPLALETGLDPGRAAQLRASERAALAAARRVVATSRATALLLAAEYGVPASRITVAPPGTDPAAAATGSGGPEVAILSVGTLVPRKGHDLLLAALSRLRALPWRLTVVGDETRDPATARALHESVRSAGLAGRVDFAGAVDAARLAALYAGADLFALASRHEGFGMAYAEALARGLPVVGTTAGGIPEAVPPGAGRLVPPDDVDALEEALRELLADRGARLRCADAALRAAAGLVRWTDTARQVAEALRGAT